MIVDNFLRISQPRESLTTRKTIFNCFYPSELLSKRRTRLEGKFMCYNLLNYFGVTKTLTLV